MDGYEIGKCLHGVDWQDWCEDCAKESEKLSQECPVGYEFGRKAI